jgi:aconitase B
MSDLGKLAGKTKKVHVGGHEIEIQPLSASDLNLMYELGEKKGAEQADLIKQLIVKSIPDATDEEVNKMSVEYLTDLQEEMMKINNLDSEKAKEKAKFLEEIKKKQSGQ